MVLHDSRHLLFLGSVIWISYTALLITAWFSCFFWNIFLGMEFLPRFLVNFYAAYLVTNSPKTLHSSEEWPAPWIIKVFDSLFGKSTYHLRRLRVLPPLVVWVFDKTGFPILFLLSTVLLASDRVVSIRRSYHIFINTFGSFHTLKHVYGLFKINRLAIKTLNIRLLIPATGHTV